MKKLSKILSLVIVAILSFCTFVACGSKPVTLKKDLPTEIDINTDLNFKNYYEEVDGASYNLYVSYVDQTGEEVTEKKLRSKIFSFEFEGVYTFKIEQVIKNKSTFLEATIECLPDAPQIKKGEIVTARRNDTRSWTQLITMSNINITPSGLSKKAVFEKVKIVKATYATTDTEPVFELEEELATNATEYTFAYEGTYTFEFSVENRKGEARSEIVVSTVDAVRADTKPELTYAAEQKTLSWNAIEGATGYRVQAGDVVEDITANSFNFAGFADGEYEVTVSPIYDTLIYPTSSVSKLYYVGAVKTPLVLGVRTHTVSWEERPFAINYQVKENGGAAVTLPKGTTSYTLTGTTYKTNDQISVEIVAVFEDESTTESASVTINYGTVTMDGMSLNVTATNTSWSGTKCGEDDNIEFVDLGEAQGDAWVMVEFTGKNAPNFAFRATKGFDSVSFAKDRETPGASLTARDYWTKAGIFFSNSYVGGRMGYLSFHTGFYSDIQTDDYGVDGGAIDYNVVMTNTIQDTDKQANSNVFVEGENTEAGFGLSNFESGKKYIQIIGYQGQGDQKTELLVTLISIRVEDDGSLTVLSNFTTGGASGRGSGVSTSIFPGKRVILYPHVDHPSVKTDDITFTYYPMADTFAGLMSTCTSAHKDAIMSALNLA